MPTSFRMDGFCRSPEPTHDFREYRTIRREENGQQVVYDNNFCLASQRQPLRLVASAKGRPYQVSR